MGASSDLDEATGLAMHMFADWGIALDSSTSASQSSNLATVINGCNPSDSPLIVDMVRRYLQSEFIQTTEILRKHRAYLDRIVTALCQRDVLTQEDFEQLWSEQEENHQQKLMDSGHITEAPPRQSDASISSTTPYAHHDA